MRILQLFALLKKHNLRALLSVNEDGNPELQVFKFVDKKRVSQAVVFSAKALAEAFAGETLMTARVKQLIAEAAAATN